MTLVYQPKPGSVIMCDFHGFVAPEMVKRRPVVVVAKNKHNSKLVTVVPLSTTEPKPIASHHYRLTQNPLPDKSKAVVIWAKCDMIVTVALARLDRYRVRKREYIVPTISDEDLGCIRQCVSRALGIDRGIPV